ncbi:MAG TPA: translation elongation factor Ts [Bacilli bacterium]|nr:translation elongation factor Ts [Bacilli bacterium]HPK86068.1 translation elongation factor Ts [Bacilli bacterium]
MATMIELIKELRATTGAGMMDCKRALEATNMDIDLAKDWLREKGITTAEKKQARIAAEGLTTALVGKNETVILEINCETDFVARGETFIQIVEDSAKLLLKHLPKTHEEADALIQPLFNEATLKIGEKLSFRRFEIIKASAENVFAYKHMGGKITSVVVLEKADQELARGLAMHIAANNPSYIKKDDIPQSEVEKETRIQTEAAKNDEELAKKPANILERIVAGRVSKAFNDNTLSEQVYLLDGEKKVGVVLKELGNTVTRFVRYQCGEGLEKRKDDFADEVMGAI